jgi:serine phosphatase RsbU (regulator of sigma subunit)
LTEWENPLLRSTKLPDLKDKRKQIGLVVALFAAITAARLAESQTGPLYLVAVVLAAFWFGRWPGLAAGAIASVLTRATIELDGDAVSPTAFAEAMRLAVYAGLGYAIGALSERQLRLERELLKKDLELEELRTLQQALAPAAAPSRPSLELATCYLPAQQGVSGDFYIVAPATEGATLIAVGDVAGRGLEAAKRAWYVRTLIVSSADVDANPASILERANRTLIDESGFGSPFITAACLLIHPDGTVHWALAGHDGPRVLDGGHPLAGDGGPGLPLGVADSLGCATSSAKLELGDGLLVYTDGLTEARRSVNGDRTSADGASELFGEERIARLLGAIDGSSPSEVLQRVQGAVREFTGGRLADDLCMVALRRVSGSGAPSRAE